MRDSDFDREVRGTISRAIRERAVIPTILEVASALGREVPAVEASFARMIEGHVFIPRRGSREIYAYDPFCVGPTAFHVAATGRDHWAICAWDALGVPPALGTTGRIDTRCPDCDEGITVEVGLGGRASARGGAVLHVGVLARDFWKDIYLT